VLRCYFTYYFITTTYIGISSQFGWHETTSKLFETLIENDILFVVWGRTVKLYKEIIWYCARKKTYYKEFTGVSSH
jgi:hypothetical protein